MNRVYLDHSATSPVDPRVFEEMTPYFTEDFGNASSLHAFGREAKEAMDRARHRVMELLGAESEKEIIFTAGGTEADNMAVKGAALKRREERDHIITSVIEHPAVLNSCKYLEKQGFRVTYLGVDETGQVDLEALKEAVTDKTSVVSVMFANNEIGTIQKVRDIGEIARERGALFHTDAVQAIGKVPMDMNELPVDLLSLSSHKIYGPKGVGVLYRRKGVAIEPLIHGGGHEWKMRSSTENIPGIVGLGKAAELARLEMPEEIPRLTALRDRLIGKVLGDIEESYLNGHPTERLCNNAHFRFSYIEGESLLLMLDMKGIAASTGSACSTGSLEPSHVLLAIGLSHELAHGSLRVSLGRSNTQDDVDYLVEVLPGIVGRLREMSPLGKGKEQAWSDACDTHGHGDEHG